MQRRKRFGEILVDAKVLDEETLGRALEQQKTSGKRLGAILEEMGIISDRDVVLILSRQFNCKTVSNISKHPFSEDVLGLIDGHTAQAKGVFPLKVEGRSLHLAITNPLDLETLDTVSFMTGMRVIPYLTTPTEVREAVRKHYLKAPDPGEPLDVTVLLIDNLELWRDFFQADLKNEGLRGVQIAGAEAFRSVLKEPPRVILVDTDVEGVNGGIEMLRALKSRKATRDIPVIALSARSSPEEEARFLDAGFFDFVAKPANPTRLMARVKRALKFSRSREKLSVA
jgi:CheY-like chemotaxis protein